MNMNCFDGFDYVCVMYGTKRQKGSYGTVLKYDGMHDSGEESGFKSRGFRSSRAKRFEFKQQDKKDFQDDEDLVSELGHLKLVPNYRDLSSVLELDLKGFETDSTVLTSNIPSAGGLKKSKKKKVKLKYHYEDELDQDSLDFEIKLKSVDSKVKFQRNLPKQLAIKQSSTDTIYKRFIKKEQSSSPKIINTIPDGYVPKYKLGNLDTAPLTKHAATSLLQSRFTNTSASSLSKQPEAQQEQQRIVQKIEVSEILKKRLGI